MQAIEFTAEISKQHEIHLKLPDDINASSVKVIVMYENTAPPFQVKKRVFGQYRGKIKISDSFDDELGDDFWLGKEE
ncbi:MAG: hypothetical protein GQ582_05165 [Methyloprofundus sp.]|nr:hypothetical protein [Methyloprofundus sp.]